MVNHTKSIISPTVSERHETSVSSFSGQAIETNRLVTDLLEANSVQGNEYFVAMNRPVLIKAQTWNLPDFPGYTFLNGEKGLTKKLCFDEIASENLAEEIKSWLLDGVANGYTYNTLCKTFRRIVVAVSGILQIHPEITSVLDITPAILAEITEKNPFLCRYNEIQRIRAVFTTFTNEMREKLTILSTVWTPEMEMKNRRWRLDKLDIPYNKNLTHGRDSISFEGIQQEWLFETAAEYIRFRLPVVSITTILGELKALELLSESIELSNPDITSLEDLTEQDGMNIICYIGSKGYAPTTRNARINALINLFETAFALGILKKDVSGIFHSYRPAKKIKRDPEVYSQAEILRIVGVLKYLPDNIARAAYIIISLGLRAGDVLMMKSDETMHENENGDFYIQTVQPKTRKLVTVPCYDHVTVQMFNAAVRESKTEFGEDCIYAFAKTKTLPVTYGCVRDNLKKVLREHDVRDDKGEPIKLLLHQFRRTKASDYINISNLPPELAAKLLGQSDTRSLGHYIKVSDSQFRDAVTPVFSYLGGLIANRGNIREAELCRSGTALRLKDGFCLRPLNAGLCEKFGGCWACRFFTAAASDLPYFKIQLEGLKLSLSQAERNGYTLISSQTAAKIQNLEKIIAGIETRLDPAKGA